MTAQPAREPFRTPTLKRVDRFRARRPDIPISAWHDNPWQVGEPGTRPAGTRAVGQRDSDGGPPRSRVPGGRQPALATRPGKLTFQAIPPPRARTKPQAHHRGSHRHQRRERPGGHARPAAGAPERPRGVEGPGHAGETAPGKALAALSPSGGLIPTAALRPAHGRRARRLAAPGSLPTPARGIRAARGPCEVLIIAEPCTSRPRRPRTARRSGPRPLSRRPRPLLRPPWCCASPCGPALDPGDHGGPWEQEKRAGHELAPPASGRKKDSPLPG